MQSLSTVRKVLTLAVVGALCIVAHAPLHAQTTSASVSGSVRDAQEAMLPGASVTLTSNTQGNVLSANTDAAGRFVFAYVRPDTYTLKISLEGFKTVERTPVVVNANDKFNAGILTLEVGQVTEVVTVVSRVTELQATSGERSFTLESKAIDSIAVNGRNFFGMVALVPGVVPGVQQDATEITSGPPTQASHFSVNGQRTNSNNMTMDGVANIDTGDNGGNMATTNLDSIAEFKVLTNSYQAEYGRAVGAQVQVVTKSGTQQFTGSAYWYGRRSDWNANTWLNNRAAAPAPLGSGAAVPMAEASRNEFGYTIGGPVYFGNFNKDKKKLFFFFSQEFQRRADPVGEQRVTVPTLLERRGDFSQSVSPTGAPANLIRDPQSGLPCTAADTRGCFQDGGVLGRIPQNRLYAPSLAALSIYPEPNVEGQTGFNYRSQAPSSQPRREELLRLDFHPNDNWHVLGRYMQNQDNRVLPYGVSWASGANVDTFQGHQNVPGYNWLVSATGILDRTTSLEVSVGSAHNSLDIGVGPEDNPLMFRSGTPNLSDLPMLYPGAVLDDAIPRFDWTGNSLNNPAGFYMHQNPFTNFNTTYDALANVTKIMGSHAVKVGVYFQRSLKDQSAFAPFNGRIDFGNNANNPFDTNNAYANAAIGTYNTFQQASQYAKPMWRYNNIEWYIQDNWKTTSRLTLDYGVRFYYVTPQYDASRIAGNFLPDGYDTAQAVRLYRPAMVNGVRVGQDPATGQTVNAAFIGRVVPNSGNRFNGSFQAGEGIDETLFSGSKFKLSPRFGFAYDITDRQTAVVRGAFAILYDRPQGNTVFDLINNPPGVQQQQLTWGRMQDLAGATPLNAPVALAPTEYEWDLPTVYQWNVGLQLKLPFDVTWDVAYVGSESRNLLLKRQINAVPYGARFLPENQDPTRGVPGGPALSNLPGGNALPDDFLRPYPGYGNINMWEFSATSNYKALQTSFNRRFQKGLMVGLNYTWSRAMGTQDNDYAGGRIDFRDQDYNYGILNINRPHNFVLNVIYQTPKVMDGPLGYLTNDWQISGVYRWMSGLPYPITVQFADGTGASNLTGSDGGQGLRPVLTGDPGSGNGSDPYRQINTSAFAPPQVGSIGNESDRLFLYGPPTNNLDLSLSKSFPLGSRRKIEVRVDAFNALNHTQFSNVNATVRFQSPSNPTITNLPYDANGNLVNPNGFGTVSAVRLPRQIQIVTRLVF